MKAGRVLPPALAGITLLLLVCNVLPASGLKHRLQAERNRLRREISVERSRALRLTREIDALQNDAFVIERAAVELWNALPEGAHAWDHAVPGE